jgi:hypothetical protein
VDLNWCAFWLAIHLDLMTVLRDTPAKAIGRQGFQRFFNGSVSVTGLELGS